MSILPFLLIGLGFSFFIDNDDDSDTVPAIPADGLSEAEVTGGGLLDFVEGMDLVVTGEPGAPAGGDQGSATLIGAEGDDTITGGTNGDVLEGAGGDDEILGGLGADRIFGGFGDDTLLSSDGADTLLGGARNDTLEGGAGRDDLSGGTGNDLLIGGGNDETPVTTIVHERLDGGEGNDALRSGDGFFAMPGGEGTDVFEITRTEMPIGVTVDPFGLRVTKVTDLDVATEQVNISLVNGDAPAAPVPFILEDLLDGSGVGVFVGGEIYVVLNGVVAADAPTVNVTSAAA